MSNILIVRPQPEAETLRNELTALGYKAHVDPVLSYEAIPGAVDEMKEVLAQGNTQLVVATSFRAVSDVAEALTGHDIHLMVVGEKAVKEAQQLGIKNVTSGGKKAQILINTILAHHNPDDGAILYARGDDISRDLLEELGQKGFEVKNVNTYRMPASESLAPETIAALRDGKIDAVLFYSERMVSTFLELAKKAGVMLQLRDVNAICLSPKVAEKARQGTWKSIVSANHPDNVSLIEVTQKTLSGQVENGLY